MSFGRRFIVVVVLISTVVAAVFGAPSAATAAPVPRSDAVSSGAYLDRLLAEINARRARVGTAPLAYVAPAANEAVSRYLADLTPLMRAHNSCSHGMGDPVAPGWDYVAAAGWAAEPGGEVLGCPMEGFYWTPEAIADAWWDSPWHFAELYGDPSATAVACGAYEGDRDGGGYQVVACITYRR